MTYIVLHDCGSVQLKDDLPESVKSNRYAIVSQFWIGYHYYRADGLELEAIPNEENLPEPSFLNKIVSHVYNPRREVRLKYREVGCYELPDVKRRILDYVAEDDDILTQFIDGTEIRRRLAKADSFDKVVAVIERMEGKHDRPTPRQ